MKKIILALITCIVAISLAAYSTFAVWTDTVTVSANRIQTGTADLQVSTDSGSSWNTTTKASSMVLTGLIPSGDTNGYSFSLWNASTANLNFTTSAQITADSGVGTANPDKLEIAVYDSTTTPEAGSGWITLTNWRSGYRSLTSTVNQGISNFKNYKIAARLLSTADNQWQGKTVTFTLTVLGTQQ